jgi:hypothetical protein
MNTPLDEYFQKHLPYEIDMMREAILALATRDKLSRFERNAFIETFCLHARNLVEFFGDDGDYGPHAFTDAEFELDSHVISARTLRRINQQISHLTKRRIDDGRRKIHGGNLKDVHQAIEAEIRHFTQHLKPEWRERWKIQTHLAIQWPEGLAMTTSSMTIYPPITYARD